MSSAIERAAALTIADDALDNAELQVAPAPVSTSVSRMHGGHATMLPQPYASEHES